MEALKWKWNYFSNHQLYFPFWNRSLLSWALSINNTPGAYTTCSYMKKFLSLTWANSCSIIPIKGCPQFVHSFPFTKMVESLPNELVESILEITTPIHSLFSNVRSSGEPEFTLWKLPDEPHDANITLADGGYLKVIAHFLVSFDADPVLGTYVQPCSIPGISVDETEVTVLPGWNDTCCHSQWGLKTPYREENTFLWCWMELVLSFTLGGVD